MQLLNRLLVVAKILLAANEDDGQARTEVQDLGDPLFVVSDGHEAAGGGIVYTFSWTLSSESGESTAKQIRMTCESG